MATAGINVSEVNGIATFSCRNDFIQITVVPELGAKIWSLTDLRTGKEWMWQPSGARLSQPASTANFAESCLGGADECIPTIEPCHWKGTALPDHGEAWARAWDMNEADLSAGRITTSVALPLSRIVFTRSVQVVDNTVHLSYRAENPTEQPIPFLWAFHPLFALHDGDRLELPEECTSVRFESGAGLPGITRGDSLAWPQPMPNVNLARFDFGIPNGAAKVYTDPIATRTARLISPASNTSLAMDFSGDFVNTFGIWINQGGWNGYRHVAIEPSTGAPDSLDIAVNDWKRFALLAPGQVAEWQLTITLSAA